MTDRNQAQHKIGNARRQSGNQVDVGTWARGYVSRNARRAGVVCWRVQDLCLGKPWWLERASQRQCRSKKSAENRLGWKGAGGTWKRVLWSGEAQTAITPCTDGEIWGEDGDDHCRCDGVTGRAWAWCFDFSIAGGSESVWRVRSGVGGSTVSTY